ncbi:MAG TPA: RNA polymerase sigma factor [Dermatophilaceae bacterium]|nr:RNA polymerase sigma factor [Dermatophilaceae bacterium]
MALRSIDAHHASTTEDLLRRARQGDDTAWSALVTAYTPVIRAVCGRHRLRPQDCEDVAQRTWLLLFRHAEQIREPERLAGWVATTARHEAFRVLRGRSRVVLHPTVEDLAGEQAEPIPLEDALVARQLAGVVRRALHTLPPVQRELLGLLFGEASVSYVEVSTRLGIPVGSIGPTRQRALHRLRRQLETSEADRGELEMLTA